MAREILCTIGPNSLNKKTIKRFEELNVNLLRINLSHTKIEDLPIVVDKIRSFTDIPICFDSEGAQIRTCLMKDGSAEFKENSIVKIVKKDIFGDSSTINFQPVDIVEELIEGDFVSIDFNSVLCQVIAVETEHVLLEVLSGGRVGSNKAVTVERDIKMSPFSEKDLAAFELAKKIGIKNVALSFVNHSSDVVQLREILGPGIRIISKVECRGALKDLEKIVIESDAILIDRGDMSRQVNIEKIPRLQKEIIETAHKNNGIVYVATNLLESMIDSQIPTRAEVNDIYNTLNDGADGLVLAAETAIGKYPSRSVEMVLKVMHEFDQSKSNPRAEIEEKKFDDYFSNSLSLLVEPHGGKLVQRYANDKEIQESNNYKKIFIDDFDKSDCELLCNGTFSPLEGYMGENELYSVLDSSKLQSGVFWPVPIILQVSEKDWNIAKNEKEVLLSHKDGAQYILSVEESFKIDFEKAVVSWFGTNSKSHPGVNRIFEKGEFALSGKLLQVSRGKLEFNTMTYTPSQMRYIFNQKGWSRVVGFHTRNVPHRAHEYLQNMALEQTLADGLFINPAVGPKKSGDFLSKPILESYKLLIENGHYPKGKTILGAFDYYPRYCGPKEAVLTALCRKNMGCSHFIVGRDHAGVKDFYKSVEIETYFKTMPDLEIKPVFFDEIGFNENKNEYENIIEGQEYLRISGTQVRKSLNNKEPVPSWFMREEVSSYLRNNIESGNSIFVS